MDSETALITTMMRDQLADAWVDYEQILSTIATQLAPNCGIMNVLGDAWNTQKPVRQIMAAWITNRIFIDLT